MEREENLRAAVRELTASFGPLRLSPVYESKAVGFQGDPFYNLAAALDSALAPQVINRQLKAIERRLGRNPQDLKFAPRPIDIDLLCYDGLRLEEAGLRLPRPEILAHAFVLKPLADLEGDLPHPGLGLSYAQLWERFSGDRTLRPVSFDW